jgi:hypothetical protein
MATLPDEEIVEQLQLLNEEDQTQLFNISTTSPAARRIRNRMEQVHTPISISLPGMVKDLRSREAFFSGYD